jgi:extracellular factor (EF) 3-hydroxypalmitic acid methyl ester biosynthesis protein
MAYGALDIFQRLRQEDVHWILASAELRTISAGNVLVREDDPSERIFFIADGLLDVYVFAGHRIKVGQLGPGEVIGEISWLDRQPVSATVQAVETSAVLALSTELLERKLSSDPGFATRFLRALATLIAERLRKTTSEVRRSEWTAAPRPLTSATEGSGILPKVAAFKALVAAADKDAIDAGGRISDENVQQVRKAFDALELAIGQQGGENISGVEDALKAELLPFIQLSETGNRYYAKPRGYAGDYQTLEMIYANAPAGVGRVGRLIDSCMLNLAAAKAIRNRRHLLAAEMQSSFMAAAKEFHVASLGCGPAREVFDVYERADDRGRLHVACVDIDREALGYVEARCREHGLADRVGTLHANLIYLATGKQELDLAPQDLIYSAGLLDSLSDELALTLIDWIYDKLRPGGRAMLANFHPRNPSRGLMDHVLDWRLTHRDEAQMSALFQKSRFAQPCTRVVFEQEGINLLAECRKP